MFKIFRGMFGQPKDLPEPFAGDALQYTFDYMKDAGEPVQKLSDNRFVWQPVKDKEVFFERTDEDLWIRSFYVSECKNYKKSITSTLSKSNYFSIVCHNDSNISINKIFSFVGAGDPKIILEETLDQWRINILDIPHKNTYSHFRPYLNGKTFISSTQAFSFYMKNIQQSRKISEDHEVIMFDTGGVLITLQKTYSNTSVSLSYGLSDLQHFLVEKAQEIIDLIQKLAQRHPKTGFFLHEKGILLTHIFHVGAETDAMELFTIQLKVIHDAVLQHLT